MKQAKLLIIMLTSLLSANSAKAQENRNIKLGFYATPLVISDVFRFKELDGAGYYERNGGFLVGVNFIKPINKRFDFETGIEFSRHKFIGHPAFTGEETSDYKTESAIVSVPVTVRACFWKYFFANGGAMIDIDAANRNDYSIDSQTGIGAILGVGAEYKFDFGISVYVNPCCKLHSLIPFNMERHHYSVWENSIRIGVTYNLNK